MAPSGFAVGIAVGVLNSMLRSLGSNLQRRHHARNRMRLEQLSEWKSLDWLAGFALFLVCQAGNAVALASVPTLVLAPLGGLGLVFNAVFAAVISGERLSSNDVLGTIFVSIGAVIVSIYGYLDSESLITTDAVGEMLGRRTVHAWIAVMWCAQLACLVYAAKLRSNLSDVLHRSAMLGSLYCTVASVFSTQSLVLAKCGAELVKTAVIVEGEREELLSSMLPRALVSIIVAYGVISVVLSNEMMKFYDMRLLAPLSFMVFVTFNTMNSFIFFETYAFMTARKLFKLFAGLLLIIIGAFFASHLLHQQP